MLGPFGLLALFDSGEAYPFGYILCGGWNGKLSLYDYVSLRFVWSDDVDDEFDFDTTIRGMCKGGRGEGWGDAWVVGTQFYTPYPALHIYRIVVWAGAQFFPDYLDETSGTTVGVEPEKTAIIAAGDLHAASTGITAVYGVWFDKADNGVIVAARLQGVPDDQRLCICKYRQGDGVVWKTFLPTVLDADGDQTPWQSRLLYGDLAFVGEDGGGYCSVYRIRLATGELIDADRWPIQGLELYGPQWYDSLHNAIYYYDHPSTVKWARIYLDRYTDSGTTLGTIVADLCERAGLLPADYDVSQLGDAVRGYLVARPTTARAAIEQLALAYFFDGVESDGKLVFRKRGMAPNFAIDEDDLLLTESDGAAISEKRTQEVDLPERVTIRFTDYARDYNASTQTIRRITHPVPTMHTKNQTLFELPISTVADEAKRWAHTHLHAAYNERSQFEFSLPAKYLALEPTDVVTLSLDDGTVLTVRVVAVDIGVDFTIRVTAVSQEMALYQSAIHGDTGLGGVSAPIAVAGATIALFPDLPLLRDGDAGGDSQHRQYFWAGGYADGWPGAVVYRSADNVSFAYLAKVPKSQAMCYGLAGNALAAPASPWATDTVNTLDVAMLRGEERLASISQDELVNGGNAALLFNPDTGFGEVIQYRDVEELGDGQLPPEQPAARPARHRHLLRPPSRRRVFDPARCGDGADGLAAAHRSRRPASVQGGDARPVARKRHPEAAPVPRLRSDAVRAGAAGGGEERQPAGHHALLDPAHPHRRRVDERLERGAAVRGERSLRGRHPDLGQRRDGQADADGDDAVGALSERADRHRLRRGAGQPQRRPLPDERRRRPRLPACRNPDGRLIIRDQPRHPMPDPRRPSPDIRHLTSGI